MGDTPTETVAEGKRIRYGESFTQGYDVVLACNDVLEFLKGVPADSAALVVTSPPYNIGKPYEDRVEFRRYLDWQDAVVKECVRVLRPEGSICWEVGNYIEPSTGEEPVDIRRGRLAVFLPR